LPRPSSSEPLRRNRRGLPGASMTAHAPSSRPLHHRAVARAPDTLVPALKRSGASGNPRAACRSPDW
jgi:hypothetical protein